LGKLEEIKNYRAEFDPYGDSRWPEDYTDWLIAELERLRTLAQRVIALPDDDPQFKPITKTARWRRLAEVTKNL
jgi:hypothetical protein